MSGIFFGATVRFGLRFFGRAKHMDRDRMRYMGAQVTDGLYVFVVYKMTSRLNDLETPHGCFFRVLRGRAHVCDLFEFCQNLDILVRSWLKNQKLPFR